MDSPVTRVKRGMRRGFVLPLALVTTVIALFVITSTARYCTTAMATSREYLGRTRDRLAAQSALEMAKNKIYGECLGQSLALPGSGGASYGADLSAVAGGLNEALRDVEFQRSVQAIAPGVNVSVEMRGGTDGMNRLIAVAELPGRVGQPPVSVTLQECFVMPLTDNGLFNYAYLANGNGHLTSRYVTVNGDVRSNSDFYITGAEVNGFIYASNKVYLARADIQSLRDWFDERDVQICTGPGYNSTYRSGRYAKVRPTNPLPLANGIYWNRGFDGVEHGNMTYSGILSIFFPSLRVEGETADVKIGQECVSAYEGRPIVSENAGPIKIPRIVAANEAETATDRRLQYFKDYAAAARTLKNSSGGGSLVCSNCFINKEGKVEQLSAELMLCCLEVTTVSNHVTRTTSTKTSTTTVSPGEKIGETTTWERPDGDKSVYGGTTVASSGGGYPPRSIPVYEYRQLSDREFGNLGRTEQGKWEKKTSGFAYLNTSNYGTSILAFESDLVAKVPAAQLNEVREYLSGKEGWSQHTFPKNGTKKSSGSWSYTTTTYYDYKSYSQVGYLQFDIGADGMLRITCHYTENNGTYKDDEPETHNKDKVAVYRHLTVTEYNRLTDKTGYDKYTVGYRETAEAGYEQEIDGVKYYFSQSDFEDRTASGYPGSREREQAITVAEDYIVGEKKWRSVKKTKDEYYSKEPVADLKLSVDRKVTGYIVIVPVYEYFVADGSYVFHVFDNSNLKTTEEKMTLDHLIPAYEWKSRRAYNESEANWPAVSSLPRAWRNSSLGISGHDNVLIYDTDLESVAAYHDGAGAGVDRQDVIDLFSGDDGWSSASSGVRSANPVGYFMIDTTTVSAKASATRMFLSAAVVERTIEKQKKVEEQFSEPTSTTTDEFGNEVQTFVTQTVATNRIDQVVRRELRRIFVNGGYRIDANPAHLEKGAALNQDPDMVLTRNDDGTVRQYLTSGVTTADLRPFRENDGVGSRTGGTETFTDSGSPSSTSKTEGNVTVKTETTVTTVTQKTTVKDVIPPHCNAMSDADKGAVVLIGTWDFPIEIDGPVVFESDVIIRGFVSGRGTIYSGRNIHVIGDINYKNPPFWPKDSDGAHDTANKDLLVLVSRGSIVVGNYVDDIMWTESDGLLGSNQHFIDAQPPHERHIWSKHGRNAARVPYTNFDYTQTDVKGFATRKLVHKKERGEDGAEHWTYGDAALKYYETVLGDWFFRSANSETLMGGTVYPKAKASESSPYYCDCRFSQHWDCNPGYMNDDYLKSQYVTYQSDILEMYAESRNWDASDRVGPARKTMADILGAYKSNFRDFCQNNYDLTKNNRLLHDAYSRKPRVEFIRRIDGVLYSSMGLFGVVGGRRTPFVLNGAMIAQDEAIMPLARHRRLFWNDTDDIDLTINWDIRLDPKSGDSVRNEEGEGQFDPPVKSFDDAAPTGTPGAPQILYWQEL